jgi:putative PEP-CTERM system integral membrane protein
MVGRADDVETALAQLNEVAGSRAAVDVYLTASAYRGQEPSRVGLAALDPDSIVYYGGQNAAELLAQFDALREDQSYDAVLVLTDDSGYDLGEGEVEVPIPDAPTWMVHLGGDFPLGYDDATLEAIQASGGGVAGDVEGALARLAVALGSAGGGTAYDVIDGYVWTTIPTEIAAGEPDAAFAPLAARQFILSTMQRERDEMDRLETLDGLHAIAVEHSVVTPYSSMIVLVTPQQERMLDDLEARGDRFEREHEDVGETVAVAVTGVPEPEEWLLIALAAALLIWYARTTQLTPRRQRIG